MRQPIATSARRGSLTARQYAQGRNVSAPPLPQQGGGLSALRRSGDAVELLGPLDVIGHDRALVDLDGERLARERRVVVVRPRRLDAVVQQDLLALRPEQEVVEEQRSRLVREPV